MESKLPLFQTLSTFSGSSLDPLFPRNLNFSSLSFSHLEKILHILQTHSLAFTLPNSKSSNQETNDKKTTDNSFITTIYDNDDWDFDKGVWKNHLSIHDPLDFPKPLYLFAYGSLCWNIAPELKSCEISKVFVKGYKRRFWQTSTDHRGTVEFPGLVCSLISDEEYENLTGVKCQELSICYGLAFEIPEGMEKEVIRALDYREKGGYKRKMVKMWLCDGEKEIEGIVYIGQTDNPHFAIKEIRENIFKCAKIIAKSEGESGKNCDYLGNLERFLKKNKFCDDYIDNLSGLVKRIQNSAGEIHKEEIIRLDDYKFDFSIVFSEENDDVFLWIWTFYDSKMKKDLLGDFTAWISSLIHLANVSYKLNSQYTKKGIELIYQMNFENGPTLNIQSLVKNFLILIFENSLN